ncbi:DNA-directed RNA polymerase III subunit rpc1 [Zancudomyces culisetae]|uniref:DNA-directed RNA polymerase n=1 Tax=Zancudomyces culisetae TaxID=1213189 RepID=A0A1R1PWQ7_ZANCU|nr:DNA-directed RNA polymerase III subunit rpc1 [Zancudomyces culisetae]|eukprot:OMH85416.1 DNA-directed RNA polymerase III subunit rpc1 [Zancudomyces culisetae]
MFQLISDEDSELMGLDKNGGRPENYLWTAVPVPPVCIRPSVAQEGEGLHRDLRENREDFGGTCREREWISQHERSRVGGKDSYISRSGYTTQQGEAEAIDYRLWRIGQGLSRGERFGLTNEFTFATDRGGASRGVDIDGGEEQFGDAEEWRADYWSNAGFYYDIVFDYAAGPVLFTGGGGADYFVLF